ncbi:MAG TPA: collagen-like protein [Puia sp.]|uniref:collagen-like triple helix repeat-containing protein n=1 Tax=Puia sp. TaxID=2045100 RepID=UPI002CBCF2F5|nr:collagen-like protein [Puia sp.]HVU96314.1 collagen-like protein [Puia sp.]
MKNQLNRKVLFGLLLSIAISSLIFPSCKKGTVGPAGAAGTAGANGANGTNGNTILSGEGAPAANLGAIGDFYLDITTTALYGPKTAGGWGSPISLVGASGTPGIPGAPGDSGATGPAGPGALVDTFSIYTDNWTMGDSVYVQHDNTNYSTFAAKSATRWIGELTQDILDHGMILVSFTPSPLNEPTQWLPIPYTIPGTDPHNMQVNYNWSYVTGVQDLRLQFYFTPYSNTTNNYYYYWPLTAGPDLPEFNVPDARYKVVIIPASVTQEITSITKRKFSNTGKVLSNL